MALDTNYFPGDREVNILAKLLILFGGSPTAADGKPELLRKILTTVKAASGSGDLALTGDITADNITATGDVAADNITASGDVAVTGNVTVQNVEINHSPLTYAATVELNFQSDGFRTVNLTGDLEFTSADLAAGRSVVIRLICDGSNRNLTFPAQWVFLGSAAPASITASKTAVLSLSCFGATDSDIVAVYAEEP